MSSHFPGKRRAATLADISREVGVSPMAVSAVLNNAKTSARISAAKRVAVIAAAKRLNYRPNAMARALADRRMNTLGVSTILAGKGLNQYFLEVFNGIVEGAAKLSQNTTVFAHETWEECLAKMPSICDGRIDGLILLAPILPASAQAELPFHTPLVAIHSDRPLAGVLNIESDEEEASYRMTQAMIKAGHRSILHAAGPLLRCGPRRRLSGWQRAMRDANLTPSLVLETSFDRIRARADLTAWLKAAPKPLPTACVCASDDIALSLIEAARELGIRVPDDLSVSGFDDTLLAQTSNPALATVRQPLREMGILAAEELVKRIDANREGVEVPSDKPIVLANEVVLRASLQPPRSQ
ncbi:MAG: LacI family DNA-binding transcriptional regulator [Opitutaceae bacterium]|nr:LacI family DNA-binding transcriptional regulator [Opitutaceae bacterium]